MTEETEEFRNRLHDAHRRLCGRNMRGTIARAYARWLRFWHLLGSKEPHRKLTMSTDGYVHAIACDCGRIFWESSYAMQTGLLRKRWRSHDEGR